MEQLLLASRSTYRAPIRWSQPLRTENMLAHFPVVNKHTGITICLNSIRVTPQRAGYNSILNVRNFHWLSRLRTLKLRV
jgi:hypothetical protein